MYRERVLLADGVLLELFFASPEKFHLRCQKQNRLLVEYANSGDYEFKSVEKLRYDFEQDVERALRQG